MPVPTKRQESSNQRQRFEETARALGCNEDEAAFDAQLAVIVQHRPKPEPKPTKALRKSAKAKP